MTFNLLSNLLNLYILFTFFSILSIFLFIKIKFSSEVEKLMNSIGDYLDISFSNITNEKKYKKLLKIIKKILIPFFKICLMLSTLFCFFYFFDLTLKKKYSYSLYEIFFSIEFLFFSSLVIIILYNKKKHHFNFVSRLMYKNFLEKYNFQKSIFLQSKQNSKQVRGVFITGLARSGSTALMVNLHEEGNFFSLRYNDLPFLMAPRLQRAFNIFNIQKNKVTERQHKDGINITSKSPEAFDEIFWKLELNNNYIKKRYIQINNLKLNNLYNFEKFINIHLKYNKKKFYLSKNNNNIIRLKSVSNYFSKCLFIVLYRNPTDHILSLKKQHSNFLNIQHTVPFSLNFMNMVGHHEFGEGIKIFQLSKKNLKFSEAKNFKFWENIWFNYYSYLLKLEKKLKQNVYFLDYKKFTDNQLILNNFVRSKFNYKSKHNSKKERFKRQYNYKKINIDKKTLKLYYMLQKNERNI